MKHFKYFFVSLICFTLLTTAQEDDAITIRNADSLIGRVEQGENIRELVGNVILEQKGVVVYCDRAIHYPQRNGAFLEGNVKVVDDTITIIADRGYYNGEVGILDGEGNLVLDDRHTRLYAQQGKYFIDTKVAEFWEHVIVHDPAGIIYADHLLHRRDEEFSTATGNVVVFDQEQDLYIFGEHLEYDSQTGYSIMRNNPMLQQVDTTDTGEIDTLLVKSEVMESFREPKRIFLAVGDVEIVRAQLAARGQTTRYFIDDDEMTLTGNPIIWYQDNQVTGDSIHVTLYERRLRSLEVFGRAFAISVSDSRFPTRFNQLTGNNLIMMFQDDEIHQIEVTDQATSLYYFYDDLEPSGINLITGDKVIIKFEEGEVFELKCIGGVEAKYHPENLVIGKEESFNLPGFLWRDDRPQLAPPERLREEIFLGEIR